MAVGATIGGPTYGTYRLVKYIRARRRHRHGRNQLPQISADGNETEDDDMTRAIQASIETAQEENARRDLERMVVVDIADEV